MGALKKIQIEKLRDTFREIMAQGGWGLIMEDFANSEDFNRLMHDLHSAHATTGITPDIKTVFRAFKECPAHELGVVVIGQDPYPTPGVADGLAFSCGITGKEQPSLRVIFNEIEKTVYPDTHYKRNPDLLRWANQGVLLLNTALTTVPGKIGMHYHIWSKFTTYVIKALSEKFQGLVFISMGSKAHEWAELIDDEKHFVLKCHHPASAVYSGGVWKSNDVFNKANNIITARGEHKIIW